MNILHVTSSLDPRGGGVAEAVRQLALALTRAGCRNEVATADAPGTGFGDGLPFPVHALGPSRGSFQYAPALAAWLRGQAAAREGKFDAVITHGLWQHHGFAAWRAFRKTATPRFVFPHGMLDPWFKRTYPRKHLKKWLYWPWAEYRSLKEARAVIFTCEEERRLARESFWLYRANEVVSPLGIEEPPGDAEQQREAFFETFPDLRGRRFWLFLGRLHVKKGCDLLLDAFGQLAAADPDARLVVAGPGEAELVESLRSRPGALGSPQRITWPGMLSGDLKWGALRAAEAFVLPSHQENFGLAVVEALACGTPVLISDKVNVWREIEADGAGFVAPDTLAGTRRLLERWRTLPPVEQAAMARRARTCFEDRFQIDRAAATLLSRMQDG